MKRTLLTLITILAVSSVIIAQPGWTLVNSNLTTGRGVGQISVGMNNPDALWAYAIFTDGSIADEFTRSTDGGLTWTKGTFNAGTGLSQLFAIDENTCWAVFNTGASQGAYKTTDGGVTWVRKPAAFGSSSFGDVIHFFNNNDGYVMGDPVGGYFEIYTTSDGGETWTRVPQANIPAPTSGEYGITGNYSAVGDNTWFGTNAGRIFRSTDKGLNWTVTLTPFGAAETVAPEFADAMNGIVFRSYLNIGIVDTICITSDGGASFFKHGVGGAMYGRYIVHIPGTAATYVGSSSEPSMNGISYSYDGGYNWTAINQGYDFQASNWVDVAKGWAGTYSTAKKSTGGMFIYAGDSLLPLQAKFDADVTAIALGQSVVFTNHSTGFPGTSKWTFEGGAPGSFNGATPPPITYNSPGSFNVTLTVYNAYTSDTLTKVDYIYVGGVGINDIQNVSFSVYPNPAKDVLNITASAPVSRIQMFNLVGQAVMDVNPGAATYSLMTSGMNPGVYTLKLTINDKPYIKKVVIQ
jgi:photosystem II stability/assembly factor-like uncharacterized protein